MAAVRGSARSARSRPKPSSRGIITSVSTRSGRARAHRGERRLAVGHRLHRRSAAPSSRRDVVAHVGVVVGRAATRALGAGRTAWRLDAPGRLRPGGSGTARVRQPAQRLLDVGRRRRAPSRPACARRADALGRQVRRARGMRDGERAALARALSTADRAAVQLDQLLHQRQADAGALVGAAARALDAVEALEDVRQLLGGNAGAGVAHRQLDAHCPVLPHGDGDLALERELERVREQVEDDLLPHVAVDVDRLGERRAVDDQRRARPARSAERKLLASSAVSAREVGRLVARPARARPRCARSRAAC